MWINRKSKKEQFIQCVINLDKQVLVLRGARQVGKTAFINDALSALKDHPQLRINLLYNTTVTAEGQEYFGRDFVGASLSGVDLIKNLQLKLGNLDALPQPVILFIDEADHYPVVLEAVQTLATFSTKLKCIITGSNLENISVKNAATGRKKYFDLFPITFTEFLVAAGKNDLLSYADSLDPSAPSQHSDYYHNQLSEILQTYLRLGGMPRLVSAHLDPGCESQSLDVLASDLVISIEENVKTVLGDKYQLYEYDDVLRTLALLSINTLKMSRLQVQHARQSAAKKLVTKTVGARVAHKIRLMNAERDLSKYIIADCGLANFLLSGSQLLTQKISPAHLAILYETFVGNTLVAQLHSRDDLLYWKSGNQAEVEFYLRSPAPFGIDVKSGLRGSPSLNSLALNEADVSAIVLVGQFPLSVENDFTAKLPNDTRQRQVKLVRMPHYLTHRVFAFVK